MAKPIVVTHSGDFHADDVFAVATLRMALGEIEVVRTRDKELIENGDYVVDVGGINDIETEQFDHHQVGGAGERANGIPYASFGLVWKKFGEQVAGDAERAERIDQSFVQSIDAIDNGVEITTQLFEDVYPQSVNGLVASFRPTWKEDSSDEEYLRRFLVLVDAAEAMLERLIIITRDYLEARSHVERAYQEAEDKRVIVLDRAYPWKEILTSLPEPIYVIYPRADSWGLKAVSVDPSTFENRKSLPESWRGKRDDELVEVTGVADAIFCHNTGYLAVARSKEGVLELAEKALLE